MAETVKIDEIVDVRGMSASVMYARTEAHGDWLNTLIAQGLSTRESLEMITDSLGERTDRVTGDRPKRNANPFRPA